MSEGEVKTFRALFSRPAAFDPYVLHLVICTTVLRHTFKLGLQSYRYLEKNIKCDHMSKRVKTRNNNIDGKEYED